MAECDSSVPADTVTWGELLAETTRRVGDSAPARWLCEQASGLAGDEFLKSLSEPATERMVAHLDSMVGRYRGGEPLAYVLGHWSFRRIEVMVDRRVLIPRPETEVLVGRALEHLAGRSPRRAADLGTGSGAIGLALADELPLADTEVWLTDLSPESLDVARANAAGLGRRAANVRIAEGSWFDALPAELVGTFDVIAANPPYVARDDADVEDSVVAWEPHTALYSDDEGLGDLRAVVTGGLDWLSPSGWLIVEIGHRQAGAVESMFIDSGYVDVSVGTDLAGRDRYVEGRRPNGQDGPRLRRRKSS